MAITLDADPTSSTFNCYATVLQGDDFFSTRLHASAWTSATTGDKEKALMWATRQMDSLTWKGVRYSGTQNLEFPRRGLSYYESSSVGGNALESVDLSVGFGFYTKIEITETEVPNFLRDATCELALWLLTEDTTAPSGTENFSRIKVDTIDIQMKPRESRRWLNQAVRDLVWRFLLNQSPYNAATRRVG